MRTGTGPPLGLVAGHDPLHLAELFEQGPLPCLELDVGQSLAALHRASEADRSAPGAAGEPSADIKSLVAATRIVAANAKALALLGYADGDRAMTASAILPEGCYKAFLELLLIAHEVGATLARSGILRCADGIDVDGLLVGRVSSVEPGKQRIVVQFLDARSVASPAELDMSRSVLQHLPLAICRVNGNLLAAYYDELGLKSEADVISCMEQNPAALRKAGGLCIIEEANPYAARIFGATGPDELIGKAVGFAWEARPDTFIQTLAAGVGCRNIECETQLTTLDGRVIDVLLTSAIVPENGRRVSIVGILDIGDRLAAHATQARLQTELAHAARLSVLGGLTSSFTQEISQPLAAIAITSSTGRRQLDRKDPLIGPARISFDQILTYVLRASGIVDRVRMMASGRVDATGPVRLGHVIASSLQMVEVPARSAGITLRTAIEGTDDWVLVDRVQIGQVIVDLVLNAIHAIDASASAVRIIEIKTASVDRFIECSVTDSGPGLPEDELARVLDEFGLDAPKGIGLALSRSILLLHDGTLGVAGTSVLGGLRVHFRLPRVPGPA